ncbi:MAG: ferritin-like domain-containing protein [Caulobacteraceae bacterium]
MKASTQACEQCAAPEAEIVIGTREQLLHLLAEAAEIEHTLMCSYLYAAFSLKRAGEAGLSLVQGEAVERWRSTILGVAVEEMGHLVIVANLTVAVGGRPHLARPNFPVSPGYFPSGVSARLTPFNEETLKHFIFLERPRGVEGHDAQGFAQPAYDRRQAVTGVMPSAQDYATVGHLYEAIEANLTALDRRLGSAALFVGAEGAQVGGSVMDLKGVAPVLDLASARAAIAVVVEQGEGCSTDQDDCHYRSFVAIQDELSRLQREDPAFAPAWPVADSPVLRDPAEPNGSVFVDHPAAAPMLDLACAIYGLLLRCLAQCFGRTGACGLDEQKRLMAAAIELMHVLGEASARLARLPATPRHPELNAGMTFTMLRGVGSLLPSAERQLLAESAADLVRVSQHVFPEASPRLGEASARLAHL